MPIFLDMQRSPKCPQKIQQMRGQMQKIFFSQRAGKQMRTSKPPSFRWHLHCSWIYNWKQENSYTPCHCFRFCAQKKVLFTFSRHNHFKLKMANPSKLPWPCVIIQPMDFFSGFMRCFSYSILLLLSQLYILNAHFALAASVNRLTDSRG